MAVSEIIIAKTGAELAGWRSQVLVPCSLLVVRGQSSMSVARNNSNSVTTTNHEQRTTNETRVRTLQTREIIGFPSHTPLNDIGKTLVILRLKVAPCRSDQGKPYTFLPRKCPGSSPPKTGFRPCLPKHEYFRSRLAQARILETNCIRFRSVRKYPGSFHL